MNTAFTTLISADQLRALLDSGNPVAVIDTSFDLADTAEGERTWREGHLASSLYLHLERDLSGPKTSSDGVFRGRHPLPDRRVFAQTLGWAWAGWACCSLPRHWHGWSKHIRGAPVFWRWGPRRCWRG